MLKKPKNPVNLPDYGEVIDSMIEIFNETWEGVENLKPKNYTEFTKEYNDFDGIEEWELNNRKIMEDKFKGIDDTSVCSSNFVRHISLPDVAYNDICQGRNPSNSFVSACVHYGVSLGEVINVKDTIYRIAMLESRIKNVIRKYIKEGKADKQLLFDCMDIEQKFVRRLLDENIPVIDPEDGKKLDETLKKLVEKK